MLFTDIIIEGSSGPFVHQSESGAICTVVVAECVLMNISEHYLFKFRPVAQEMSSPTFR